jgi:hypothetical protein
MVEAINHDYEVSSEGAVRHWEIPYAHLSDATPTETNPAAVISPTFTAGTQLTGTILALDVARSVAIIDFTCGMVYYQEVRNVLTYNAQAENTWGPIDIGDRVYYDRSATMPAGVYLSTAPADNLGGANPLFGFVVPANPVDMALYPKGAGGVGSTHHCGVAQRGAGA